MKNPANQPIGVFDSGVGGLTIVRELERRLPHEPIIYFGDTARVPYGPKAPATVLRYAREAADFLLSHNVKMIVVACNTATAHAIEALESELEIPVVGVVEPGARTAVEASQSGRIGVIGTAGTVASNAYDKAIRALDTNADVFQQPCPLFVPIVEEGWAEHEAARLIAEEYLRPLQEIEIDVLIMGCTHYPILEPLLSDVLGPTITLVDSAAETAADVEMILDIENMLHEEQNPTQHRVYVSDSPIRFAETSRFFLGNGMHEVHEVQLGDYE